MSPEVLAALSDILRAGQEVRRICGDLNEDLFRVVSTERMAVERLFIVIGEGLIRVRQRDPASFASITDSEKIVAFRNLLVHGYDAIDAGVLWRITGEPLDILLREIEVLLPGSVD